MAVGSLIGVSSHGLFGVPVACDYPDESDVVAGVVYAYDTMTGNVTLPSESDVVDGVGYGSLGTQFTGTFQCGNPLPPTVQSPFAAIAYAIRNQLSASLGLDIAYIHSVANANYKVTEVEPMFAYVQYMGVAKPRDAGLDFTNAGAGRLWTPVARRVRVYLYTRSGGDVYGTDDLALFGADPTQTYDTPPVYPGHFVAEEVVYNSLLNWLPLNADDEPLTIGPLHPLDASEYPQRAAEDEEGLLRSCLDFEVVYTLAVDPTDSAPTG